MFRFIWKKNVWIRESRSHLLLVGETPFSLQKSQNYFGFNPIHLGGTFLMVSFQILTQASDLSKVFSTIQLDPLIEMSIQGEPEVRILIGKVLVALIAANRRTSISISLQPDVWWFDKRILIGRLTKAAGKIHKGVLQQAFLPNNAPENFASMYEVLEALFSTNRGHELEYSIPLIFRLQVNNWIMTRSKSRSKRRKPILISTEQCKLLWQHICWISHNFMITLTWEITSSLEWLANGVLHFITTMENWKQREIVSSSQKKP